MAAKKPAPKKAAPTKPKSAPTVESHADIDVQEHSFDAANSTYVSKDVPEGSGSAVEQVLGKP